MQLAALTWWIYRPVSRNLWLNWLRRSLLRRNIKGMENISNEKTQSHAGFVLWSMSASNRLYFGETCQMRHGGCVVLPEPPPAARSRTFSRVYIRVSSGVSNSLLNLNEEHRDGLKNPTAPGPQGDDIITRWGGPISFLLRVIFLLYQHIQTVNTTADGPHSSPFKDQTGPTPVRTSCGLKQRRSCSEILHARFLLQFWRRNFTEF